MTQLELFRPRESGAHVIETPVVGRITFAPTPPVQKIDVVTMFQGQHSNGKMHAGNIESSKRLKDTIRFLAKGDWHTTLEISCFTGSMAVHSDIAALRENGIAVESKCSKGRIWRYRITPSILSGVEQ